MHFDLSGLPDYPVHVSGFGGNDIGVLELDPMAPDDAVFGYSRLILKLQAALEQLTVKAQSTHTKCCERGRAI
jgi:hypothetical protein